jgi:hypothetical protein
MMAIVGSGIAPALNHIWAANCSPSARGRIFTWYSVAAEVTTMLGSLIAAALLDGFHFGSIHWTGRADNYQVLYPVAGVVGFIGMLWFWRIRLRFSHGQEPERETPGLGRRLVGALAQARDLLRRDPDFRLYEFGFFLYGTAFMMCVPVVPILFKNALGANYKTFSFTTVVLVQVMHLAMAPLIVKLASGRRVTVVTRMPMALLIGYPALLALVAIVAPASRDVATWLAYAAFALFGCAMALIHFVWNLGPVAFARGRNALPYTSTHAALVGFRASVGFPLAYLLMKVFPDQPVPIFVLAMGFFLGATLVMTKLDKRLRARGGSFEMTR